MAKEIDSVIRWKNGMVMVFDQNGDQMSDYQGNWKDVKHKIVEDMPNHVEIQGPRSWTDSFPNKTIVNARGIHTHPAPPGASGGA